MTVLPRFALAALLLSSGCAGTAPYERRIADLTWRLEAAEQASEQAAVDRRLAEREVGLAQTQARVLQEQLALAHDALREARARQDDSLHTRLTELSQSTETDGHALEISQYGGLVLESGVFFASGSHQLTAEGQRVLQPLVARLRGAEYAGYEVDLAGHTDTDPIARSAERYRDNYDLAALRANSVRRFLVEQGIEEGRIHLTSWGPARPLVPDDKRRNRRVEIVLRQTEGTTSATTVPAGSPREDEPRGS